MITQTQTEVIFIHLLPSTTPQQPLSIVIAPLLLLFQGNCLSVIYTTSFLFCFSSQQRLKTRDQNKTVFIAKITRLQNETKHSPLFFNDNIFLKKNNNYQDPGPNGCRSLLRKILQSNIILVEFTEFHNDVTNQQAKQRHFNTKKMTSQVILTDRA